MKKLILVLSFCCFFSCTPGCGALGDVTVPDIVDASSGLTEDVISAANTVQDLISLIGGTIVPMFAKDSDNCDILAKELGAKDADKAEIVKVSTQCSTMTDSYDVVIEDVDALGSGANGDLIIEKTQDDIRAYARDTDVVKRSLRSYGYGL